MDYCDLSTILITLKNSLKRISMSIENAPVEMTKKVIYWQREALTQSCDNFDTTMLNII